MGGGVTNELHAATVSTQIARTILQGAAAYGHDFTSLAARFDLSEQDLADPDARIPAPQAMRMWQEVPRIVDDDRFGLRLGERASGAGVLPVVGYIVQTSPTLGEGITRALRYQRLVQTLNRAELEMTESTGRLVVHVRAAHVEPLRHAIDFVLAFMMSLASRLTGSRVVPQRVCLAHERPPQIDDHERVFGKRVHFSAPVTEIIFERTLLDRPVLSTDLQLRGLIERHAAALLGRLPGGDGLVDRTRIALAESLRTGRTRVRDVARQLRMSTRTLQRRLGGERTSHAELLESVRRDLALRYVTDPALSLTEVAFLLGFADQTTFHRAFVRWTGKAPGAFRKRLASKVIYAPSR
jgi:AraC-like DNA-binding protein